MSAIMYVKCTDCGLLLRKTGSLHDMGILDGNNCPNCGGEVILLMEQPKQVTIPH
ncbi:MAG: hypothetical protein JXA00_01375 [Candidatus Thermoplasmatota archaeon]|nr:hypothetical protein [Candidatus Thermoplasmatota archaeon]